MLRPGIRRLFRLFLRRRDVIDESVDDEIRVHLEMRTEDLVRRGWTPERARDEALRRFGPLDEGRRTLRGAARRREDTMSARDWLAGLLQDLRYSVRALRREGGFAAVVVATLALGIGANAMMFGIVDRLLLRGPDHVRDPERVVRFYQTVTLPARGDFTTGSAGYILYSTFRDRTTSFEGVAAYARRGFTIASGAEARAIDVGAATWDLFPLLGVAPSFGRFFGQSEDRAGDAQRVLVLDHGFWQRFFGGDSTVIGRTIVLSDEAFTIIGVAPAGFTGPELRRLDGWIPMAVHSRTTSPDWPTSWNVQWLSVIGRLRPGVSTERASQDATAAFRAAYTGGDSVEAVARISLAPLQFDNSGQEATEIAISRWVVGVAAIMLIIACANVANLFFARAMRRRREVAVRLALGVGRARLARLLLAESVILGVVGGAAALIIARWGGAVLRATLFPQVAWNAPPLDGRVLAFTAALALATGMVTGLVPALQASRPDLTDALRSGVREGGGRRGRLHVVLTVVQAALSVVLLVGAGLFVHSLYMIRTLDLGFEPDRVLTFATSWPSLAGRSADDATRERARRNQVIDDVAARVRSLPGVERSAVSVGTPFRTSFTQRLRVDGWDSLPRLRGGGPYISAVMPDYFETMGLGLVRGRLFSGADRVGSARVAVVNETMARTLWPEREALGACLFVEQQPCAAVVGVVRDAQRQALREEPAMQYYIPLGQEVGMGGRVLLVRPRDGAVGVGEAVRSELLAADPTLGYVTMQTLQEWIDPQVRPWRLGAMMFGIFGGLALLVAAVGLYSVIAYLVTQRTHELGVRIALGAQRGDVLSLIVGHGVRSAVAGIAIGLVLALLAGPRVERLLFDTSPHDPLVLATVAVTLFVVAVLASLVPAWRATRVDPMSALRAD